MWVRPLTVFLAFVFSVVLLGQPQGLGPQQPARDTPAQNQQKQNAPAPTSRITGRVVATDSGRPVQRARVQIRARELPGGRVALTDDSGVFDFTALPAGRYTVSVSKIGYIALEYGQRRPLQPGIPLEVGDGEQLRGVDVSLPKGGVITGRIVDEVGEPAPGAAVRVLRYRYVGDERQLVSAGTARTDDRGEYRVWGLDPGDYYVNAVTQIPATKVGPGGSAAAAAPRGTSAAMRSVDGSTEEDAVNYAPTYYPGVPSPADALPLTVGVSQEQQDVNFNLLLVQTSNLAGRVMNPGGDPATNGSISLAAEGTASGARGALGQNYGGRINRDGGFVIRGLPPGRYVLRASSDDTGVQAYASQPITMAGGVDVSDMMVLLQLGGSVRGTIEFESSTASSTSNFRFVRIAAVAADNGDFGVRLPIARVDGTGTFTLDGVPAGAHFISAADGVLGWTLKQVLLDGRDVTDTPVEVRSNKELSGVTVVFTDRLTHLTGVVTDQSGQPVTDFTVLAFPTDVSLWRSQSRQIMTARPDQNGKYEIQGLPPGDYYITIVDPTEPGEWFDPTFLQAHVQSATHLTLNEGDALARDFQVTLR